MIKPINGALPTRTATATIAEPAPVLNAKEASRFLGISVPTMRLLLKEGEIPYRKTGKLYLISRKALENWLERE